MTAKLIYGSAWRAAEKVVYSKTLKQLSMPMARLEPTFDAEAVRDTLQGRPGRRDQTLHRAHHRRRWQEVGDGDAWRT